MEGHLEVQAPFDLHFGHDVFTDDGRKELDRLMGDEALYCEHWAPECKLFSRARGSRYNWQMEGRCKAPNQSGTRSI